MKVLRSMVIICASTVLINPLFADSFKKKCLDTFMDHLQINPQMMSDPEVMKDVAINEFYLEEFPEALELISDALSTPVSLEPLLNSIQHGILYRQPAVLEMICVSQSKNLIPKPDQFAQSLISRSVHNMYILETIVQKMVSDPEFFMKVRNHYVHEREKILPADSSYLLVYKATGGFFEMAKYLTMDQVILQYHDLLDKSIFTDEDLKNKSFGLRTNILEATLTDQASFNFNNATVGAALMDSPVISMEKTNHILKQYFQPGWSPLYETWNMAFVTGNLDNLHIVLPKLFIPSVIDAPEEDYLMFRGISLWITIHLYLLNNLHDKSIVKLPEAVKDPIVTELGRINKAYAQKINLKPSHFSMKFVVSLAAEALGRAAGW